MVEKDEPLKQMEAARKVELHDLVVRLKNLAKLSLNDHASTS